MDSKKVASQNAFNAYSFDRILIINLGGVGDFLLSSPSLRALRGKYKSSRIDLFSVGNTAEFARSYGLFDNIYVYKNNFLDLIKALTVLRANKYGLAANMRTIASLRGAVKMFLLFLFVGARKWAGRNTDGLGFFFSISIPETYMAERPEYEYDIELVKKLGIEVKNTGIHVPFTSDDIEYTENLLKQNGLSAQDFIVGINPGGQVSRRWPEKRFGQLCSLFLAGNNYKIILTGAKSEKELCARIAAGLDPKRIINLAGLTAISSLSLIIRKCKIFISNDTGTMHVCVSVDVPGVFLFGGGNLTRFAPFKNKSLYRVIHKNAECSPCEDMNCKNLKCMNDISVSEVHGAAAELIRGNYAR